MSDDLLYAVGLGVKELRADRDALKLAVDRLSAGPPVIFCDQHDGAADRKILEAYDRMTLDLYALILELHKLDAALKTKSAKAAVQMVLERLTEIRPLNPAEADEVQGIGA